MNQNQVKVIQSRLKTRGKKFTLEQLRNNILIDYHDDELTEEQMSAIVEKMSGSSELVQTDASELTHNQKESLIQEVASELKVDLSVEQVKRLSQEMDWALRDRATLRKKICAAIIAWTNHKFEQDALSTDEMMDEVEQHFVRRLKQNNQHFNKRVNEFSGEVNQAIEKFRTAEAEILDLFKIPG
ncbi:MAG: hypothetical protein RMY28_009675 [Nostoc sp. ChiSLP01]|nr:hypothetical protein [Nostoc sp. CmiSLP01]MDZ8285177.1 hypothetical protein [Nostoc sp. ChiSLP01]